MSPLKVGGWEFVGVPATSLPQKLATGFVKAFEHYVGASYEPIYYVAKQLVNGTNYKLVCKGKMVTAEPFGFCAKVILHEDLNGNFSVMHIDEI